MEAAEASAPAAIDLVLVRQELAADHAGVQPTARRVLHGVSDVFGLRLGVARVLAHLAAPAFERRALVGPHEPRVRANRLAVARGRGQEITRPAAATSRRRLIEREGGPRYGPPSRQCRWFSRR